MNCENVIKQRRSIRKYKSQPIKKSELMAIIDAGIWAPSGLNNQPWKFKIITDQKTKKDMEQFTKYSHIIKSAAALICVFLDTQQMYNRDKDLMAVGACIENMLLMTHQLGLGACWLGEILNQKDDVCAFLDLDKDLELTAVISLGYPAEKNQSGKRKNISEFLIT
jgi:nitroreductase